MAGKYEICFEPYERYGGSAPRVAKFSAPDDFTALKKVAEKCSLYVNEDEFFDSEAEALEAGYDESELEDLYIRDKTDIEDIVTAMTDCDGQDFIFYITRPDGSYLFDSGCDSGSDDWDEDDIPCDC